MKKIIMCFLALMLSYTNISASDKKINVFYNDLRFERSIKYCISRANKKQYLEFIEPVFSKY